MVMVLLVLAFLAGGGSMDRGWGDVAAQLLAWPVLVMATVRLGRDGTRAQRRVAIAAALLPAGVALQWITGATSTPWATERALWALLPALAMFMAAIALPYRELPRLAWTVVVLAAASLALGFLQLGAPQDSLLNPFPEWAPSLNGVFANPNHQATALAIALVLLLAWAFGDAPAASRDGRWWMARLAAAGLGLFLLIGLPLTGSRAAVLITAAALLAVPVCNGWLGRRLRQRTQRRIGLAAAIAGGVLAALLLVAASTWLRVDQQQESRAALFAATARMAADAMPRGIGVGGFVPWFEAHAPLPLLHWEYFNHAHNEYLQWWLEGGIAGLAWIALLAAGMWWTRPRPGRGQRPGWLAVGSWLAVAVALAHSAVDYPLRTPALMTVTALLAGIAASSRLAAARRGPQEIDATMPDDDDWRT